MQLVTNTYIFTPILGEEQTIRLIAGAGFDAIDWTFMREFGEGSPWLKSNWKDHAQKMLDTAAECGITFRQAHSPYPSSRGTEPYDTDVMHYIRRSMEAAAFLGIRHMVIHPKHHLPYKTHRQQMMQESVQMYKDLIPFCEEYGIKVCCENMWQYDKKRNVIIDSICSCPEEFCELLDTVNSPWITGCLDIGHCALVSQDPAHFIRTMGSHLQALHVHDVDLLDDTHTMPFVGRIDWESVCTALAQIGYTGDFTFEANGWFEPLPPALFADAARMLERTGRYLIGQIQNGSK